MNNMTREQALAHILDLASRFGENAEEGFARRVQSSDTDDDCLRNAEQSGYKLEEVTLIRDLWRAIDLLTVKG